jgi:hypothetical protein
LGERFLEQSAASREITDNHFRGATYVFTTGPRAVDSKEPMTWRLFMLRVRLAGWTGLRSVSRSRYPEAQAS